MTTPFLPADTPAGLPALAAEIARQAVEEAIRSLPVPRMRPGSVRGAGALGGAIRVVLDGDSVELDFPTLEPGLEPGARVMVWLYPPSGGLIVGRIQTGNRSPASAFDSGSGTTTSATYTDLTGAAVGPSVTLETGPRAAVFHQTIANQNTAGGFAIQAPAVSGATTYAANDADAVYSQMAQLGEVPLSGHVVLANLNPGLNTFTLKYRVGSGTGSWLRRRILVVPLW